MTFKWMREVSEKCLNFRLSSEPHSAPEESSHHFLNLINESFREIAIDFIQQGCSAMWSNALCIHFLFLQGFSIAHYLGIRPEHK